MASLDLKSPVLRDPAERAPVGRRARRVLLHALHSVRLPDQREQIDALKVDYEKKSTELARARATVADLPRFEAEYEQLHQRWSLAAELLPTDRQVRRCCARSRSRGSRPACSS
jgi:hypothetical protein